jgi:hypothetical protein
MFICLRGRLYRARCVTRVRTVSHESNIMRFANCVTNSAEVPGRALYLSYSNSAPAA